jgi:hypothetical protein
MPGFAPPGAGIIVLVEAPMTIPAELRQALEWAGNEPVRIEDPETRGAYVLLRADVYERMRALMEAEEIDPSFFEIDDFESVPGIPRSATGAGARADRAAIIGRVVEALRAGNIAAARETLRNEYPFVAVVPESRRYTDVQALQVFVRDGFIDRYSGQRLLFPGVLRLLSRLLPEEFPYHPNWKTAETHPAYYELFPTIDHVVSVTRDGKDREENWVTTSMARNATKANWKLEEIGWSLHPPGSLAEWDGLMRFFVEFVASNRSLLEDAYLGRWYRAAGSCPGTTEHLAGHWRSNG